MEEVPYFVSYVVSGSKSGQQIDNGVVLHHRRVWSISDIRAMEKSIEGRVTQLTGDGTPIIGAKDAVQVRIISYYRINRE